MGKEKAGKKLSPSGIKSSSATQKFVWEFLRHLFCTQGRVLKGMCLSLPRVIGLTGVMAKLRSDLSSKEHLALQESANILREAAISLKMMQGTEVSVEATKLFRDQQKI